MNPNGIQDPLLTGDAEFMLRQIAGKLANYELELATRDSIIDKLYSRLRELENENASLRFEKEKAEA